MDPYSLAIPFAFILLAAVLCLLLIDSRWGWKKKLALIVIVPAFGLAVWSSIASYKGWPTTVSLPKKALVFWTLIREPDAAHGDKGAIYVWAIPYEEKEAASLNPLKYITPGNEPRAYQLPYSRRLHAGLDGAKPGMGQGKPVVLEMGDVPPSGNGGQGEQGEQGEDDGDNDSSTNNPSGTHRRGGQGYGTEEDRRDFRLYQLPPPHPPEKIPEQ